jgi:hypothetical protein
MRKISRPSLRNWGWDGRGRLATSAPFFHLDLASAIALFTMMMTRRVPASLYKQTKVLGPVMTVAVFVFTGPRPRLYKHEERV